jgi:hypothetical protein
VFYEGVYESVVPCQTDGLRIPGNSGTENRLGKNPARNMLRIKKHHKFLIPLEARPGQEIEAQVVIDNKGIAPIYRPYHFALRFLQGKTAYVVRFRNDIRKWMPDLTFFREKIRFPRQLKEGEVRVSCGIVNDEDKPVVRFAIKDVEPDGWHPLTGMDVLKD